MLFYALSMHVFLCGYVCLSSTTITQCVDVWHWKELPQWKARTPQLSAVRI